MFIQQPYDSKILAHIDKTNITYLVNRYNINDFSYISSREKLLSNGFNFNRSFPLRPIVMFGLSSTEKEIPNLDFPFLDPKGNWVCFDMRNYYTVDRKSLEAVPKRSSDIEFVMTRNLLTALWMGGESKELSFLDLPMEVYGKWLSSLIFKRVGVDDLAQQADVDILSRIFYMRLFTRPEERVNEKEKVLNKFKTSFYTTESVERIYDLCGDMETVADYCRHLEIVTENVRFENFSEGVLYAMVQPSWSGLSSKDNTAIAVEYPPVWIAMVYTSLKNVFYKKSTIGTLAQNAGKRNQGQSFISSVDELLKQLGA